MTERRDFSEATQAWLDGDVSAEPTPQQRADAERLVEGSRAYARSLDVPGAECDVAIMEAIRSRPVDEPATPVSFWRWLLEPWTIRIRPAFAMVGVAAAVIAVVMIRGGGSDLAPPPLEASSDVLVRFELTAPEASRVTLAGTFNGWNPDSVDLALNPVTGVWSVSLPVRPGEHQYLFVIDGTRWMPDPLAHAQIDDGFGQTNSLVVVSGPGVRS